MNKWLLDLSSSIGQSGYPLSCPPQFANVNIQLPLSHADTVTKRRKWDCRNEQTAVARIYQTTLSSSYVVLNWARN